MRAAPKAVRSFRPERTANDRAVTFSGPSAVGVSADPLAAARVEMLRHRAQFLRAAKARRQSTPGFLLQARRRDEADAGPTIRVGFTCSKKLGNAVSRNRAKRRLRAVAREILPREGQPGWDYVLIGRPQATIERPFGALKSDLRFALERIHRDAAPKTPRREDEGAR